MAILLILQLLIIILFVISLVCCVRSYRKYCHNEKILEELAVLFIIKISLYTATYCDKTRNTLSVRKCTIFMKIARNLVWYEKSWSTWLWEYRARKHFKAGYSQPPISNVQILNKSKLLVTGTAGLAAAEAEKSENYKI